ncbi:MAG: hypothetical protein V1725_02700 [archaeon]
MNTTTNDTTDLCDKVSKLTRELILNYVDLRKTYSDNQNAEKEVRNRIAQLDPQSPDAKIAGEIINTLETIRRQYNIIMSIAESHLSVYTGESNIKEMQDEKLLSLKSIYDPNLKIQEHNPTIKQK